MINCKLSGLSVSVYKPCSPGEPRCHRHSNNNKIIIIIKITEGDNGRKNKRLLFGCWLSYCRFWRSEFVMVKEVSGLTASQIVPTLPVIAEVYSRWSWLAVETARMARNCLEMYRDPFFAQTFGSSQSQLGGRLVWRSTKNKVTTFHTRATIVFVLNEIMYMHGS